MERDPLRLAWKTKPARHLLGFGLLTLAGLLLLVGLDLVRIVVDRAIGGGPPLADTAVLRFVITPPAGLWPEPLVLFPGFALGPEAFAIATIGGLVLVPVLIALLLTLLDSLIGGINHRLGRHLLLPPRRAHRRHHPAAGRRRAVGVRRPHRRRPAR